MCGIAGVIAWEDRYRTSRQTLARLSARIAHRGPDGEGLYLNHEQQITPTRPQVALAHRRLAIIDLDPRANQPFTDHQGRHLVFNGEIYNYRELHAELTHLNPAYPWRTTSDTEVLLAAYAHWGENCLSRLNGMFAFAIWDENNQSLFLARDRMGQKPLYWARGEGVFAFASELGALTALPWFRRDIDGWAWRSYMELGYVLGSATIYQSARRLEPGCWLRPLSRQPPAVQRYFEPNLVTEENRRLSATSASAVDATRRLLTQAVQRQLVADVPLGCYLSGGIDSSIVALLMRRLAGEGQAIETFSIGFDDPRYDETAYAAQVARHLGTRHHEFRVRPDAAADLPRLAQIFAEPFADSSALPTHYLARETRRHVKVALSGDGGDELFGGYERYQAVRWAQRLDVLPRRLRQVLARTISRVIPGTHPKSRGARLKRFLQTVHLPTLERYESYVRLFSQEQMDALDDVTTLPAGWSYPDPAEGPHQRDPVQAALALDRIQYLPDDLLTKLDRASMLHALEVRSPFMDHDLVQFAASLTTPQLLRGGPKRMLREAFAADLPDFVFKRRKMGFAVPIGEWLRHELRPMLHDLLFSTDSFASQHFHRPTLQRLIDEHEQFHIDHSQRLYALLMLELWWRTQNSGP